MTEEVTQEVASAFSAEPHKSTRTDKIEAHGENLKLKDALIKVAKDLTNASKSGIERAKKKYDSSDLKDHVEESNRTLKTFLDDKGVTEKYQQIQSGIGNELDTLSGKKIMEQLVAHITLQEQYNDILAGKLEEALQRIEQLLIST